MEQLSRLQLYSSMLDNQAIASNYNYSTMLEVNTIILSDIENLFLSPDQAPEQKAIIDPEFRETFIRNLNSLNNRNNRDQDVELLLRKLGKLLEMQNVRNVEPTSRSRSLFNKILNELAVYNGRILHLNRFPIAGRKRGKLPQVFLSHAYIDRLYAWALFEYFYDRDTFLYVDWMNQKDQKDGRVLKNNLENALADSEQLLFIRSVNSELDINGKHIIRPWCSWELGNFYTKNKDEKYFINLYSVRDYKDKSNIQIHGMKLFQDVVGQKLTGPAI